MGIFTLIRHPLQTIKALSFASKVIEQKNVKYLPKEPSLPETEQQIDGNRQRGRYSDLKRLDDELKKEERELEYLTLKAEKELELERLALDKEKLIREREELYEDDEDDEEPQNRGNSPEMMLMNVITKAMSKPQATQQPQTKTITPQPTQTPTPAVQVQSATNRVYSDTQLQMVLNYLPEDQKAFLNSASDEDIITLKSFLK